MYELELYDSYGLIDPQYIGGHTKPIVAIRNMTIMFTQQYDKECYLAPYLIG